MSADWWDCLPCSGNGWGSLWLSAEQRAAIHATLCHVHRKQLEDERKAWDQMGRNFDEMMKDPVRKKEWEDNVRAKFGRKGRYT